MCLVKSGYWLGKLGVVPLVNDNQNALWDKVWSVQGPPKMCQFLWRACKGSLPVRLLRFHRHMHSSPMCTRCNNGEDSLCHVVLDCANFRTVWATSPFHSLIADAPRDSFDCLFLWLHSHASTNDFSIVCAAMWACWMGRNQQVLENSSCDVAKLAVALCRLVVEHGNYVQKIKTIPKCSVLQYSVCQPPMQCVKINFGAHVSDGDTRVLGVVLRDDHGSILLTGTRKVQARWSVEISEIYAALYGLLLARRIGYKRVHLEGDAQNVVTAIQDHVHGFSNVQLIYDCCFEVLSFIDFSMFSHVRRIGNTVAHMVAR